MEDTSQQPSAGRSSRCSSRGQSEPPWVVFARAGSDATVLHQPAARRPGDRRSPATPTGGYRHPAARHFRLHAPVVVVCVPCPAAPPEGAVRLRVSNRLRGFLRRDPERTSSGLAEHQTLADLLVHGTVAPVLQGGAHALVALRELQASRWFQRSKTLLPRR
jgi:hypothetical protein